MAYYIPYLEQIPVGRDKDGKGIYLDGEKAGNRVIMEAADRDRLHIVMRMDLVESILRRGAVGIGLKEIKVW